MKTITKKIEDKGVTTPYDFTEEEFLEEIRKGEEGPFYSLEDAEVLLEKWKNVRRKR